MGRPALALIASLLAAACGDPVMVLGDWPGTLQVVAGVPDSAGSRLDAVATRALLRNPVGVAADAAGTLYVADRENDRVLAVSSAGAMSVLADRTDCAASRCLMQPLALALQDDGGLIVTTRAGGIVWRVDTRTGAVQRIAGTGSGGIDPDGTRALDARLAHPAGVAAHPDGRLFIAETDANRIRVIDAQGVLRTVAGTGSAGAGGDGGTATAAMLNRPEGVALAGSTLYVADTQNHSIRAIDLLTGTITRVGGAGLPGYAGDGGPAAQALFREPAALAVTTDGRQLVVADRGNHRVRSIDLRTGIVQPFAGSGEPGSPPDRGSAGTIPLARPSGVAVSPHGLLFIADTDHHVVWRGPVGY